MSFREKAKFAYIRNIFFIYSRIILRFFNQIIFFIFVNKKKISLKPKFTPNKNKLSNKDVENIFLFYERIISAEKKLGLWGDIINDNFKLFHKYLNEKNHDEFRELFTNLGGAKFTIGLGLIGSIPSSFIRKIYTNNFVFKNISILNEKNFNLEQLDMDVDFGNLMYFDYNNTKINSTSLSHLYYASEILDLDQNQKNIVEIGGGYGGLCHMLYKKLNFRGSYSIIDLNEILIIAFVYLKQALPQTNIILVDDVNQLNLQKDTIYLIPESLKNHLPKNYFDTCFNSRSLTEFDNSVFNDYLKVINNITKKNFIEFNHEWEYLYYDNLTKKYKRHNSFKNINEFYDFKLIESEYDQTFVEKSYIKKIYKKISEL